MPAPTLIDVLVRTAASAGCEEPTRLRHTLELASDKHQPLIEALVDANMVDEDRFFAQLATGLGMPFSENGIADAAEGLHTRFPAKLALRHRICPAQVANGAVTILTYNPFDLSARQAVGQELHQSVHWQIAPRHRILEALHQGYGVGAENFEELLEGREAGDDNDDMKQETTVLDEADEEATVMNFVNQVFREGLKERATDIHVEPLERDLRIRYRVDGKLLEVPVPPNVRLLQASLISRLKIMAHLDIAER
ncbi:MAG: Flp pilus assembly complex ATPase component TadA, partial [Verrucomicrobiaceae bacterium]|nr:Flp pilus assembly complex ATPase component TadA [Verrucomicrobiaceae bacterium]